MARICQTLHWTKSTRLTTESLDKNIYQPVVCKSTSSNGMYIDIGTYSITHSNIHTQLFTNKCYAKKSEAKRTEPILWKKFFVLCFREYF